MANPLGELFGNIAASIRKGLGDVGKMKPSSFPSRVEEIVSLMGDVEDDGNEINKALDKINGEIIGERLFHITFMCNGVELIKVPVYERYDCEDPVVSGMIETPTIPGTKYIFYEYIGWNADESSSSADDGALLDVRSDRTVYAVFKEEKVTVAKGTIVHPEYGNKTYWSIDPDYVITIDANYETYNIAHYAPYLTGGECPPWWGYRELITAAVLNCNYLGHGWFYNCTNLCSVTFSENLLATAMRVFENCKSLTSITLPSKLRLISDNSFHNCSITNITIPDVMKRIRYGAFYGNPLESANFERKTGWTYAEKFSSIYKEIEPEQLQDNTFAAKMLAEHEYDFENSETV